MSALDTNILVRWLVDDDARQSARVHKLFASAQANQATLFVPATVLLEAEWVLRSRYRFDKPAVLEAFGALLETRELEFQMEAGVEWALHLYRQGTADFAGCLHAGLCGVADKAPLLTFDAEAASLPGVELLEA